jgi:hypothetical protein
VSGYLSVRDWRGFQHYDPARRQPTWIKLYTELLQSDDFLALSSHQRSLLFHIWLAYASSRCHLKADTRSLRSRFQFRVSKRDIEALTDAGFLDIVASKGLAEGYQEARPRASARARAKNQKQTVVPRQRGRLLRRTLRSLLMASAMNARSAQADTWSTARR